MAFLWLIHGGYFSDLRYLGSQPPSCLPCGFFPLGLVCFFPPRNFSSSKRHLDPCHVAYLAGTIQLATTETSRQKPVTVRTILVEKNPPLTQGTRNSNRNKGHLGSRSLKINHGYVSLPKGTCNGGSIEPRKNPTGYFPLKYCLLNDGIYGILI